MAKAHSGLKDWLIVLVALADDIGVLALILVLLWIFKIEISLWGIIALTLVLGSIIFLVHRAIIPSLRLRKRTGAEGMEGAIGEVVEPLKPDGVVKVDGEYWRARAVDEEINAGEDIEVLGLNHLVLQVKRKK